MRRLTAADILRAPDLPVLELAIPEWDGTVGVRRLAAAERFAFHQYQAGLPPESFDHVAVLVSLTAVDETGARLFTDTDVKALNDKSPQALIRVFRAAMEHNRLGDTEVERAKGES